MSAFFLLIVSRECGKYSGVWITYTCHQHLLCFFEARSI